jgi:hypothetical protein
MVSLNRPVPAGRSCVQAPFRFEYIPLPKRELVKPPPEPAGTRRNSAGNRFPFQMWRASPSHAVRSLSPNQSPERRTQRARLSLFQVGA